MRRTTFLTAVVLALAACSAEDDTFPWDGFSDGATDPGTDGWADGYGDGWADVTGDTVRVTGTVWSPGRMVPISGALVSFALSEPDPIPDHAYPETCEDPASPFHALSAPDGSFALDVLPGTYHLVVQKGQFRRVREYTVPDTGPVEITDTFTTLPNADGPGDTIPNMALLYALSGGDHIEDVLAKLTLGSTESDGTLVMGSQEFDIYNVDPYEPNTALLEDLSRMLGYHIIFFPCTISGSPQIGHPTEPLEHETVRANIRAFLDAGGKIYATDMMYDVFEQPLPMYVEFCGDDDVMNAADEEAWAHVETQSGWTSHGWSADDDLSAWLSALGLAPDDIDLHENFVWIDGLYAAPPDAPPGDPVSPKVWVFGDFVLDPGRTLPLTITFPVGAGKVLFSTYHTVGDMTGPELIPQEYILVYLIMEIGVCQSPLI
jgi:hypothetical protein